MSLISFMTRIHFADRVLEDALPEELGKLNVKRPLIVTDEAGENEDCLERLLDALPADCDPVHLSGYRPQVKPAQVRATSKAYLKNGCDAVIGFGGAVALDLARVIDAPPRSGSQVHLLTIPTTTESVGLGPVGGAISNLPVFHAKNPSVVLCDATLTLGNNAYATAIAGMDTLTHCLEAYLGTAFNPPADGIALEGLRRAMRHLARAVEDERDMEARREMLAAALNAGLSARKGLGGIDAAAKALEVEAGMCGRHGSLNAALLPHILTFNLPAVNAPAVGDRYARIANRDGRPRKPTPSITLAEFGARIGLPDRIGHLGLGPDAACSAWHSAAAADPCHADQSAPCDAGGLPRSLDPRRVRVRKAAGIVLALRDAGAAHNAL
jgi:4-hydroxybutyrate dehydrogenase